MNSFIKRIRRQPFGCSNRPLRYISTGDGHQYTVRFRSLNPCKEKEPLQINVVLFQLKKLSKLSKISLLS